MPRLKVTSGNQSGKTFDVTKPTIIGRGETAQVQINDKNASREHCKVFEQGGVWVVADLNSRNGFKVNGVQTTRKNLAHGDKIVIGETVVEFEMTAAGGKSAAPAAKAGDSKKEAAFAAARASAPSKGGQAAAAKKAASAEGGGLKVSDHVLQFNKIDAKTATVLDIDLAQSAGMSTLLVTVGCVAFLGLVVWGVVKLMS